MSSARSWSSWVRAGSGTTTGSGPTWCSVRPRRSAATTTERPGTATSWGRVSRWATGTTLREYTTVHSGSAHPTRVGSDCFVMNKVYVGHDGDIGDGVTMASSVTLGGHVTVGDRANLGLGAIVHQRRVIGPGVMLGMGSVVSRDVPPFAKAFGNPVRVKGVNSVGMTRQGIDAAVTESLAEHYRVGGSLADWAAPEALRPALEWWLARTASHEGHVTTVSNRS